MSYPAAKINAVKAAVQGAIDAHNNYRDVFNPRTTAVFQQIDAADNSPEMAALKALQAKFDAAATAHNASIPFITDASDKWNAASPNDPPPPPQPATSANVALQANGGVASASSTLASAGTFTDFRPGGANNGDRKGSNWGSGGGWNDATQGAFPDILQITFNGTYNIGRVDVFSIQDNFSAPVEPTATMTFTQFGLTAFRVEYWNGITWSLAAAVTVNNLVWRTVTFTPVATNSIRIVVNAASDSRSRAAEVEAWTAPEVTTTPTPLPFPPPADAPATPPPPSGNESPEMAQASLIKDRWGNVWSQAPNGAVLRNGETFVNSGAAATTGEPPFLYYRRTLFKNTGANTWWQWFWTQNPVAGQPMPLGDWAQVYGHPFAYRYFPTDYPTPAANESPYGTRGNSVTDLYGRVWTFGAQQGDGNKQVLRNGISPGQGGFGVEFTYMNHNVVLKTADGWYWDWDDYQYDGAFFQMTRHDPLMIDAGTVDYSIDGGIIHTGLRDSLTETQTRAAPEIVIYGETTKTALATDWVGANADTELPGLIQFTKWPDRGDVDVVRCGGRPWGGPDLMSGFRGIPGQRTELWLNAPTMVVPKTSANMHEFGIKLSGIEATQFNFSARMWMRTPFFSLPNHHQLQLYIYDQQQAGIGLLTDAFIRDSDKRGLTLHLKGNTFTNGAANANGVYEMFLDQKLIMRLTNRILFADPAAYFTTLTIQAYHGGVGCAFAPMDDPAGNALEIQYGPHVLATVNPGVLKTTAVPLPSWIDQTWPPYTVHEIPNTNYGTGVGYPQQFDYCGLAVCVRPGEERLVNVANSGHAISSDNRVTGITLRSAAPTWALLRAQSTVAAIANADNNIFGPDDGHYTDNLPASAHNYHNCAVIGNKAVRMHCQNRAYGGGNWWGSDSFDLTRNDWDLPPGTGFPASAPVASTMDHVCQDPENEDIYLQGGTQSVYRFRKGAANWELFATGPLDHQWAHLAGAFDTKRRRRVGVFGYWPWDTASAPGQMVWHDIQSNTWGKVALIPDPAHGLPIGWELDGATYDPNADVIAYCAQEDGNGNFALWTVHPVSGQVTYKMPLPKAGAGPCRGRFEYFPGLKGIVYVPLSANIRYIPTAPLS